MKTGRNEELWNPKKLLLGLLADIHEHIDNLDRAIAMFRDHRVDKIVSLGDACDMFGPAGRAGEVVALLREANAVGVWGNHDFGLCCDVQELVHKRTESAILDYMATMQPQLVIDTCRFSHVEPWLNAHSVEDLWYFDGPPDTAEKASKSFAAVPERHLFIGHFHRWLVMTMNQRID